MSENMKGAYPHMKKNEVGMTMIEMLITLSIFLIIASIMPSVFSLWKKGNETAIIYEELTLFFAQLQTDSRGYLDFWTNESHTIIYFSNGDASDLIQYEQYQDKIRRRVNRTGHEVFLQGVQAFHVEESSIGLFIQVTSVDGTIHEKKLILPAALGEQS